MTRRFFLLFFCFIAAAASVSAQSPTTVVILVRHAEKAVTPVEDPPLTEAGVVRAYALASALLHMNVQAVIVTELTRTRETARPFAEANGVKIETVHTGGGEAHARAVAAAVRAHAGQTVLVVGHTNTIPAIIAELGGPKLPDICDSQYSGFYTLVLRGNKAELAISSYGAPSPDPATTCPKSMK
ncbi:MAG TPA: histidine phosphatase family protein [Gemmatimonadaceae bacterium]|jgi:phosphohistidine phosphatase SixA|nr:histidine phosphatase family protein [Gemmatimonadaceae bacterium]